MKTGLEELVKAASTRSARELLQRVETLAPGFAQKARRLAQGQHWSSLLEDLPMTSEMEGLHQAAFKTSPGRSAGRISQQRIGDSAAIRAPKIKTPMDAAMHQEGLRRHVSGRHLPRADEVSIPAAGWGEDVANPAAPAGNFMFRGDPLPARDAAFVSRHPDVASAYSLGRVGGRSSSPTGRLFAFDRGTTPHLGETHSSSGDANPLDHARRLANPMPPSKSPYASVRRLHDSQAFSSNTYEDIVPLSGGHPTPVGEYAPRMSRTPQGNPAYAVRTISGAPASEVFPQSTNHGKEAALVCAGLSSVLSRRRR